jgi:hypothetical protein
MVDQRALKILFHRYWTAKGWREESEQVTSEADFAYAKQAGVMFDDETFTHDEAILRVMGAVSALTPYRVAEAFVASLSTRRLELRSALGSYGTFRYATPHSLQGDFSCSVCGSYQSEKADLNVLNFERYKWGGVRHYQAVYAALDLELFAKEPVLPVSAEDVSILKTIMAAIRQAGPTTTASQLQKMIGTLFKSNKAERENVVAILGYCGVFNTPGYPDQFTSFVSYTERECSDYKGDIPPPAGWWKAGQGINEDALTTYFGPWL